MRLDCSVVLRLVFAGLLGVLTEAAGVGLVGTATWMIVRAADQPPLAALAVAIASVRLFALLKGGIRYSERLAGHDVVLRVLASLRTRTFAALVDRRGVVHGDALSRVVSDVDAVQDLLLRAVLPAAVAALVGTLAVAGLLLVSVPAALVLLAALLIAGLVLPLLGRLLTRHSAELATARARVVESTVDIAHGAAELLAFGAMPSFLADASARGRRLARLESRAASAGAVVSGAAALVPSGSALAIALLVAGPSAPVLALVALTVGEVVVPLAAAAARQSDVGSAVRRVRELVDDAAGSDAVASRPRGGVVRRVRPRGGVGRGRVDSAAGAEAAERRAWVGPVSLRLRGVTVRYPHGGRDALTDVDLTLPAGRRVAVVGASGAGKSTLLSVLAGGLGVVDGRVEGRPEGAEPWQVAGGVFADAYVFHATVRENLLLDRGGFADADLRGALAAAGLGEYGERLDELVGEDGGRLSGGQRQRLLLARALLDPPPVLLLDEPTEGLDPAAADAVLATALQAAGDRTVVVVTHRRADLASFDDVVTVDDGRVSIVSGGSGLVSAP
ncbi:thiol reductant ABC exporter subunit CydC [Dactylosporangium sp. NPDC051541]|uniref:thiol reductant ABC exporter subunit CydC n=1 Tax=Dactylosporangium sp. NPDC051541 TaxID=3363977 RepID=UPI0037B77176